MASKWPAVKNSAYIFRCVLFAQSDNQIKSNPSLSSGDWKVSIDGGAFANLATLPDVDPDSSVQVLVSLSAGEMNGDEIMVTAIDAAGAEWHSAAWVIHTAAQTLDTMDANIDAILTDTAEIGAAGAGLTALATQASVNDVPTNAELTAAIAAGDDAVLAAIALLNNLSSAGAQAAAAAALAAYDAATGADVAALHNLDAAGVRAAVGLAAANLDAQLTDLPTGADLTAALADLPTNAELNARTLPAADYFDPAADTVATVGTVTNPVTAGTVSDKTGYALSGAGVTAAQSGLATAASIAALTDVTAAEILAAWDAATVDGTITRAQLERILLAFAGGETTGAGTDDVAFLGQDGTTERIAATMSSGNRAAVVLNGA